MPAAPQFPRLTRPRSGEGQSLAGTPPVSTSDHQMSNLERDGESVVPFDAEVVAPAEPASNPQRLNLNVDPQKTRGTVRQLARSAGKEDEAFGLPQGDAFSRAINNSAARDCRTAYVALGVLAAPLFLRDAASDGGCKW